MKASVKLANEQTNKQTSQKLRTSQLLHIAHQQAMPSRRKAKNRTTKDLYNSPLTTVKSRQKRWNRAAASFVGKSWSEARIRARNMAVDDRQLRSSLRQKKHRARVPLQDVAPDGESRDSAAMCSPRR